jgi:hypothetical protein
VFSGGCVGTSEEQGDTCDTPFPYLPYARETGPVSIEERRRRYAAINRCASYSDEIIDLNVRIMRDENEPSAERRAAGKWLWESAFGRPVQPIADSSEGTVRHVHIVRW